MAVFSHWAWLLRGAAPFLVLSRFGMKSGAGELLPRPLGEGWGGGIFYSLPGWGRVRVGRGPEGIFGFFCFVFCFVFIYFLLFLFIFAYFPS